MVSWRLSPSQRFEKGAPKLHVGHHSGTSTMTESSEEAEKRALREFEGKNIAHYSVLLGAWIETRMERDKTLVTLSAAAIGLLVTILTTVGTKNLWEIPLFVVAVLSFLVTILSSLTIYQLNSRHLEAAIKGSSEKDPRLERYDKISIWAFIVGASAALAIGISSATYQFPIKEERNMSEQKSSDKSVRPTTLRESVNGVTNLQPSATVAGNKSLDGVTNLKPQATQQTTQTQSQSQAQSNTATPNNSGGSAEGGQK